MRPFTAAAAFFTATLVLRIGAPAAASDGWADAATALAVAKERDLVVRVVVPLCHNGQIDCGSPRAGDPDDLEHNLCWGAIFGHKRCKRCTKHT